MPLCHQPADCLFLSSSSLPLFLPTSHSTSPFPRPPEYIKTLFLFYLYVNAPRHCFPVLLSVLHRKRHHFFIYGEQCRELLNGVDSEQIMLFYGRIHSPSCCLFIKFQLVVFLINVKAFIDIIIVTGIIA